jgi:hypothetical protein
MVKRGAHKGYLPSLLSERNAATVRMRAAGKGMTRED